MDSVSRYRLGDEDFLEQRSSPQAQFVRIGTQIKSSVLRITDVGIRSQSLGAPSS